MSQVTIGPRLNMSETLDGAMAPVASGERIDVIDILRGMTLFGILAANMRGFNAPSQVYFNIGRMYSGTADTIAQAFIDFFVQGKCVTLFAFLFGLGFAVQMDRAEERGKSISFYPRRLAILLVIGLMHSLLVCFENGHRRRLPFGLSSSTVVSF
jgi:uncharacterized protein